MNAPPPSKRSRREIMQHLAALGAGSGLLGLGSGLAAAAAAEPELETTRIRLVKIPSICQAPQYMAEELLALEGFTDIKYIKKSGTVGIQEALASGEADINNLFAAQLIRQLDKGDPIVVLSGLHTGCFELFGTNRVASLRDLKGKSLAVWNLGSVQHIFLATILAHVGIDPDSEVTWVTEPPKVAKKLFAAGKVDAYLGFPPDPQELRAKGIGHVLLDSTVDRPWRQFFCCLVAGHKKFVQDNPVATKRALRAILKANAICALEPKRAARFIVDGGFTASYEYALDNMRRIPYGQWRNFSAEDSMRFYALRMREAGLIKSTPNRLISQGTDFRFMKDLRRELKT